MAAGCLTSCLVAQHHMHHAARLALRGFGRVEPNPMVGCVIVQAVDGKRDEVVGWGFHRRLGESHAEIEAIRRAGPNARGATAFVTLEPCAHHGRTPPCTRAIIDAGIARVVIAQRDPNPAASGGAAELRAAGVEVIIDESCDLAQNVAAPFRHRIETGLPWVIAKWAQTIDGRVAARSGESRWISSLRSRRLVHRLRGRVDVILSGIGTVLADDPLLTARQVRIRRVARRVIIDPDLRTPLKSKIIRSACEAPTSIAARVSLLDSGEAAALRDAGVEIIAIPEPEAAPTQQVNLPLAPVLRHLVAAHNATTVLTECGPGLLSAMFVQDLVNDALVFTAPRLLGDDEAAAALRGFRTDRLSGAIALSLIDHRRRADDVVALYRRQR